MSAFNYRALDASGSLKKGTLEADSERQARQQLRDLGLLPTQIEAVRLQTEQPHSRGFRLERSLSNSDVALFTRQLSTLVESSIPLEESLHAITRQTDNKRLRSTVLAIRTRILEGHTLADALAQYPRSFSDLYRAMVAAGEHSGSLGQVLMRLAEYSESQQQVRSKIQVALIYPAALTTVATGVIMLLMTYVVPKVVAQFEHMDQTLPQLTRIVIALSDGLQAYGLHLLGLGIALVVLIRWLLGKPAQRLAWHRLQLRLPLIRRFILTQQSLQFARTLAILVGSGLDLMQSLKVATAPVTNLFLKQAVIDATERVREGSSLAQALEQSGSFPPMLVYMIASGEQSGQLEQMLARAAENQQAEFETRVAWLVGLFEPALILVMGCVVLAIVLAILLPILQMNNLTAL
ncbi:MAG: general secretion pathway protein F [Motiliproteus sp.]|jgi:general secretion pathway protein F